MKPKHGSILCSPALLAMARTSEATISALSVIFSVASIFVIYLLGAVLFDNGSA